MNNKKMYGVFSVVLVVLVVVSLIGITYAAYTEELSVNGTATVNSSSWKIKFTNLGSAVKTGTANEITSPTINTNDTKIGDYAVTLTTPGDSISYTFDVENAGTFDASVSSLTIPTPVCTGTGDNATTDADNVCKYLTYTLTYADGTAISTEDTLNVSETKSLKLTLTYSANVPANELPTNDVAISNLATTIIYSQAS